MATCTVTDAVVLPAGSLQIGVFTTKSLNASSKKVVKIYCFQGFFIFGVRLLHGVFVWCGQHSKSAQWWRSAGSVHCDRIGQYGLYRLHETRNVLIFGQLY
ncbi:hypothetical protein NP493_193g04064 [Ridgeia piscesae]|uniref:Uncharacterized protein n=1 Tax=Ridgeia piscesae TaxID=27915 RepID=A0AAD9P231_RIDPI|nr:hypothetical protein NP493_193g04064 [Ridgeia piscesae]